MHEYERKEWMTEAKEIAGEDWDYYCLHYSFETAMEEGMTPRGAVKDCQERLNT